MLIKKIALFLVLVSTCSEGWGQKSYTPQHLNRDGGSLHKVHDNFVREDREHELHEVDIWELDSSYTDPWDMEAQKWSEANIRIIREKDENANPSLYATYNRSSPAEKWQPLNRVLYTNDIIEKEGTEVMQSWNTTSEEWETFDKVGYGYNDGGDYTFLEFYDWSAEINGWIVSYKYTYEYNERSKETLSQGFAWNAELSEWEIHNKTESLYANQSGETYSYNWNGADWVILSKGELQFDDDDNKVYEIYYQYNSENGQWLNTAKLFHAYNEEGKRLNYELYTWDMSESKWKGGHKYTINYNSFGKDSSIVNYTWNSDIDEWHFESKIEYIYSEDKLATEAIEYGWDDDNEGWEFRNRRRQFFSKAIETEAAIEGQTIAYGENKIIDCNKFFSTKKEAALSYKATSDAGTLISTTVEQGQLKLRALQNINAIDTVTLTATVGVYSLSQRFPVKVNMITGIDDNQIQQIVTYPNPVFDIINLRTDAFLKETVWVLRTYTGEVIKTGIFDDTNDIKQIDVAGLSSGVYLLQFSDGKQSIDSKFIIR